MKAVSNADGTWFVVGGDTTIAGPFETSAAAWRWIDQRHGEPLNPSERRTERMWRMKHVEH